MEELCPLVTSEVRPHNLAAKGLLYLGTQRYRTRQVARDEAWEEGKVSEKQDSVSRAATSSFAGPSEPGPAASSFLGSAPSLSACSIYSGLAFIVMDLSDVPETALAETENWKRWLVYRGNFLQEYEQLGHLLTDLQCGSGPSFRVQADQVYSDPDPQNTATFRALLAGHTATKHIVGELARWTATLHEGTLRAYLKNKVAANHLVLKKLLEDEIVPLARIKGIACHIEPGPGVQDARQPVDGQLTSHVEPDSVQ